MSTDTLQTHPLNTLLPPHLHFFVLANAVIRIRDAEFSSDFNHKANFSGFTPLHYAVVTGNKKMVETLLSHGADPLIANSRGLLPQAYASSEIAQFLKEKESKVSNEHG